MNDFHAAWARENQKAVEAAWEERVAKGTLYVCLHGSQLDRCLFCGPPVEPLDSPVGQSMSQDRQDIDETPADTNPCKPGCP